MAGQLFREKSIERITSPEQLNDFLKVTKPAVWIVLIAVVVLLAGAFAWGAFTYIGSKLQVKADVYDGIMTATVENVSLSPDDIGEDMVIYAAGESFSVEHADVGQDGIIAVMAETDLNDGTYDATLEYKKTRILSLLFDSN